MYTKFFLAYSPPLKTTYRDNNFSKILAAGNFSNLEIHRSLDRGCNFLLEKQNPDGSWGSARQTKGLNIFAPVPKSHRAFRLAVTALSISALIRKNQMIKILLNVLIRDKLFC